jgi:mannose-1-phosphate guanylyltransferase
LRMRRFKTAFILGAGLGTRLKPLTDRCPKPLLPVRGRPVITYGMDRLIEAGVDRFIINTHHCPEVYDEKFPDRSWRGIPITFRHEPLLLDTAGGLKNIEDLLGDDEAIFCYNGDVLCGFPLKRLADFHETRRPEVTLALRSKGSLLNVNVNERDEVCDLRHTLGNKGVQSCLFTGIYAVETSFLQYVEPRKVESVIPVFLGRITERPGSIMGLVMDDGSWHDIGTVEEYERLRTGGTDGIIP